MPGPNGECCGKCYFWDEDGGAVDRDDEGNVSELYCVRYPPSFRNEEGEHEFWPSTLRHSWCGEFRPKE